MGSRRKRWQAFAGLFLPAVLALLLHGAWLLMRLEPLPPRSAPSVPALKAFPNPSSHIWTPILFSLPSPTGFSSVTRGDPVSVLPPLQSPLRLSIRQPFAVTDAFPEQNLPPLHIPATSTALTPSLPLQTATPVPSRLGWVLRSLEEGGGPLQIQRIPRIPATARPLYLEGVMDFDRFGQVAHLLIDPPGVPEAQRLDILQSLLQVRIRAENAPARLRFRLSLEPR